MVVDNGLTLTVSVFTAITPNGPHQTIVSHTLQPGIKVFFSLQPTGGVNESITEPPHNGAPSDVTGLDVINPGMQGTKTPGTVNELTAPKGPK